MTEAVNLLAARIRAIILAAAGIITDDSDSDIEIADAIRAAAHQRGTPDTTTDAAEEGKQAILAAAVAVATRYPEPTLRAFTAMLDENYGSHHQRRWRTAAVANMLRNSLDEAERAGTLPSRPEPTERSIAEAERAILDTEAASRLPREWKISVSWKPRSSEAGIAPETKHYEHLTEPRESSTGIVWDILAEHWPHDLHQPDDSSEMEITGIVITLQNPPPHSWDNGISLIHSDITEAYRTGKIPSSAIRLTAPEPPVAIPTSECENCATLAPAIRDENAGESVCPDCGFIAIPDPDRDDMNQQPSEEAVRQFAEREQLELIDPPSRWDIKILSEAYPRNGYETSQLRLDLTASYDVREENPDAEPSDDEEARDWEAAEEAIELAVRDWEAETGITTGTRLVSGTNAAFRNADGMPERAYIVTMFHRANTNPDYGSEPEPHEHEPRYTLERQEPQSFGDTAHIREECECGHTSDRVISYDRYTHLYTEERYEWLPPEAGQDSPAVISRFQFDTEPDDYWQR